MTGKDCIHEQVCEGSINRSRSVEKNCKYFKNKADFVEVCRCKDCENYNGHRYCTYHADPVLDDDFCSYGEKRSDT